MDQSCGHRQPSKRPQYIWGLDFDERFRNDPVKQAPAPFVDPFPTTGALPRCAAGLSGSAQPSVLAPDAEWRTLEGLRFILWHLKYIRHAEAFAYVMQWFGFDFQVHLKPGVMLQFVSEEGIGKSAIFGRNRNGPGIVMRIYGRYYQWSDDVESLLDSWASSTGTQWTVFSAWWKRPAPTEKGINTTTR